MAVYRGTLPEVFEARQAELFYMEYDLEAPQYTKVFNVKSSSKAYEDWFEVSGLGIFRLKPEGSAITYDQPVQGTRRRSVHHTFALGYRVSMEAMEDAQYSVIDQHPKDLGTAGREHREILCWGLFNDAFTGSTYVTIDGLSLCNTAHVILKPKDPTAATYSNQLNIALSVTGLESAITQMRLMKTREDRFFDPQLATLLVHPSAEHLAYQITNSEKEPFTNENQPNTVKTSRTGLNTISVPYLSDLDDWFVLAQKSKHKLTYHNRMEMTFSSGKDSQTKDALFDAMYRGSVAAKDWRGVIGSSV